MRFCTRCGSRMIDRDTCGVCGASAYKAPHRSPVAEYAPTGDLPAFNFKYPVPFLGLVERERDVSVPFSYINGTLLDIRTHEVSGHSVHVKLWSQQDDPKLGPRGPIVGRQSQPSIRNIVRLRLGSGAERSFLLTQVRFRAKAGDRIALIFPAPVERAINPVYDDDAIAAVDYAANDFTWSTTHPEIHAIRSPLPEELAEAFGDSLASYLNGLCRRCLRLFGGQRDERRRYRIAAEHQELTR